MLLIDGDHLFVYRIGFAVEKDPNGMLAANYNIQAAIKSYMEDCHEVKIKIFLTGSGNFRNKVATLLPYKGNRVNARKPKYYNQIRDHLIEVYDAVVVDGMEADDALGIAQIKNSHLHSEHDGDTLYCESIIVACDKDMDMIPGNHYNPIKKKHYFITEMEAIRNFYLQCLTGDSTDNIPGLSGVGPVTARRILDNYETEAELSIAVADAYLSRCCYKGGDCNNFELKLKGVTKNFQKRSDCLTCLAEIKELLWIRRE